MATNINLETLYAKIGTATAICPGKPVDSMLPQKLY
jgi:hypothetical protein